MFQADLKGLHYTCEVRLKADTTYGGSVAAGDYGTRDALQVAL